MNRNKIKDYLNIANKAGYLIIGGEQLENYNKKLYLILYSSTAQKNTLKIVEKLKNKEIEVLQIDILEDLSSIKNCKLLGIKNKGISDIIVDLYNKKGD